MQLIFIVFLGMILAVLGAIMLIYSLILRSRNKKSLKTMISGVICLVIGLFFVSILFGLGIDYYPFDNDYYNIGIIVQEITTEPDDFYNMSEEELQNYPSLQEAIQSPGSEIETTRDEYNDIVDLISNQGSIIKYQDKFYQLAVSS